MPCATRQIQTVANAQLHCSSESLACRVLVRHATLHDAHCSVCKSAYRRWSIWKHCIASNNSLSADVSFQRRNLTAFAMPEHIAFVMLACMHLHDCALVCTCTAPAHAQKSFIEFCTAFAMAACIASERLACMQSHDCAHVRTCTTPAHSQPSLVHPYTQSSCTSKTALHKGSTLDEVTILKPHIVKAVSHLFNIQMITPL